MPTDHKFLRLCEPCRKAEQGPWDQEQQKHKDEQRGKQPRLEPVARVGDDLFQPFSVEQIRAGKEAQKDAEEELPRRRQQAGKLQQNIHHNRVFTQYSPML